MILSMASPPEAKRLRAVVKASVLSLTIMCICPSAVSNGRRGGEGGGEDETSGLSTYSHTCPYGHEKPMEINYLNIHKGTGL